MIDPNNLKKYIAFIPLGDNAELHQLPLNFDMQSAYIMASELLGTDYAETHEVTTNEYGAVVKMTAFTRKQGEGEPINQHVTDQFMEKFNVLVFFEGDCVLYVEPAFVESAGL